MEHSPHITVERVTAPAVQPLSLAEVKLFLRIEHALEDALLATLIAAACEAAEAATGRSLITQSQRVRIGGDHYGVITLPRGPIQTIQTVASVLDGASTTLDPEHYRLHAARGLVQLLSTPAADEIVITYVAGYGDEAADVPSLIRQGMLQHVAKLYEQREEGVAAVPDLARALYQPYREMRL